MAYEVKNVLKQSQSMGLTPQIQQAIKILALNRQELECMLTEELRDNPILEEIELGKEENIDNTEFTALSDDLREYENASESTLGVDDIRGSEELFQRMSDSISPAEERMSKELDQTKDTSGYELLNIKQNNLHQEIEAQLITMSLTPYEFECCLILLQYLDDSGYLNMSLENIVQEHDMNFDDLSYALSVIQSVEPAGIGAKDLQDSLLLQLQRLEKVPKLVKLILQDHWIEFKKQDLGSLSRDLKVNLEDIKKALKFIRSNLDPKPARQFGLNNQHWISPDVFIFKRDGKWVISTNEDGLPRLKLSAKYTLLIQSLNKNNGDNNKTRSYLLEKLKNAKWILKALTERKKTILRVTEVILNKQLNFFDHGVNYLKPMTLKDISNQLGIHESTVSRSTSNKYLQCPRGIFELKYFFSSGISTNDDNCPATETIKSWITEYINSENINSTLSDQDLVDLIDKERHIKIARRTVAKYRESLNILSSNKRAKMLSMK